MVIDDKICCIKLTANIWNISIIRMKKKILKIKIYGPNYISTFIRVKFMIIQEKKEEKLQVIYIYIYIRSVKMFAT